MSTSVLQTVNSVNVSCLSMIHMMMNEYDLGHVMLSLWYPTLAVQYYFFTENVSILMSFVKEDADVDYISLDLHLIKCTLISVWNILFVSSDPVVMLDVMHFKWALQQYKAEFHQVLCSIMFRS